MSVVQGMQSDINNINHFAIKAPSIYTYIPILAALFKNQLIIILTVNREKENDKFYF